MYVFPFFIIAPLENLAMLESSYAIREDGFFVLAASYDR